jgi:hypothetical protein
MTQHCPGVQAPNHQSLKVCVGNTIQLPDSTSVTSFIHVAATLYQGKKILVTNEMKTKWPPWPL